MTFIDGVALLLTSFLASASFAPFVILLYQRLGWIDDPAVQPQPKTVHTTPVPRGGGLVVAAGIAVALWFIPTIDAALRGIMLGALILLVSGTLDDRYDINPYVRYLLNILAAACVVLGGVGIDYVTNPLGSGVIHLDTWKLHFMLGALPLTFSVVGDSLALLWIVWNMNAVNWSKGVDGQLPGFVSLAALFIALLSLRFQGDINQAVVTTLALCVSGAYAGLLLWNAYPQRMMPGYAGGSLAGFFLAVLAIVSGAKLATAFLLLAIPLADGVFAVVRRLSQGRSPFWGDRGHLHHRMLDAGWGKRRIAFFYWASTAVFGVMALQFDSRSKLYALVAAGILFILLVVWLTRSISFSGQRDRASG